MTLSAVNYSCLFSEDIRYGWNITSVRLALFLDLVE